MQFFHEIRVCRVVEKVPGASIPYVVLEYGEGKTCRVPRDSMRDYLGETFEGYPLGGIVIACVNYRHPQRRLRCRRGDYSGIIIIKAETSWPVGTLLVPTGYNYVYRDPGGVYGWEFKLGFEVRHVDGQFILETVRVLWGVGKFSDLDGLRLAPEVTTI